MGAVVGRALLALMLLSASSGGVRAADRHAVVIGNAAYARLPLANPRNDAREIAASLRDLGFSTDLAEDLHREELSGAVATIRTRFAPGSVGVFYFAGHALQHAGINYLLPVDYAGGGAGGLPAGAVPLDAVLDALHAAGVRLAVVILDACRDNPFGRPEEALGPGLAVVGDAPGETLIAYATSAGALAADGDGPNSPFTAALVSALEWPGLGVYDVFRQVRAAVRESTEGRQIPWVAGSLETDFVFRRPTVREIPPLIDVTPAGIYWSAIEDSSNPVDFARFVASGPEPALEALARSQRERLEASGAPGTPPPVLVREEPAGPPAGILGSLTECDVAAARPGDPRRLSPGVPPGLVNTRLALRACAAAAGARPNDPRLGYQLGRVLDIAGRFDEARRFYEAAAGADYPAALFALGFMHRVGRGVDPDPARAAALVRRAPELGHAAARNTLGYHYLNGIGVPRSPEEAFRWVRLAADDGWASALDQLANLYLRGEGVGRDERKAFDLYAQAAGLGSTNAMNNLGRMLRDGAGVTRDVDAARTWFERASADGNAYAARELGQMHRRGAGAPKDTRRAAALYELAAERGFVEAYADLAAMYEGGDGPERDAGEAYFHYRLTLESGRRRERGFAHEAAEAGVARLGPRLTAEARALIEERLRDHLARLGPVPPLHAI